MSASWVLGGQTSPRWVFSDFPMGMGSCYIIPLLLVEYTIYGGYSFKSCHGDLCRIQSTGNTPPVSQMSVTPTSILQPQSWPPSGVTRYGGGRGKLNITKGLQLSLGVGREVACHLRATGREQSEWHARWLQQGAAEQVSEREI